MTLAYVDTGLLVKLYVPEPNSPGAIRLVLGYPAPLPLTEWQELELRTALRVKAFRQIIDAAELRQSLAAFASDISDGRWERSASLQPDVWRNAEALSNQYAMYVGCRTLDVLHVAAALVIGARDFLTSDVRQAELARRTGMNVRTV